MFNRNRKSSTPHRDRGHDMPASILFPMMADAMFHGTFPSRDQINAGVGERKVRRGKKARRKSKLTRMARRKNRA